MIFFILFSKIFYILYRFQILDQSFC